MATRITPLTYGIVGTLLFGGLTAGYFHLKSEGKLPTPDDVAVTVPGLGGADKASPSHTAPAVQVNAEAIGTRSNPLKVGLNTFHGFAPGIYANGNNLKTQAGSIFDRKGVQVEFVIQDNVPTLAEAWTAGTTHCSWRTSDFWAQEQPNLRTAKLDGRTIMVVDNTQGADAIVAKDPSIKSIEDLSGHSIALLQYTPSHGMLVDALENSSLSGRKRQSVKQVFINIEEGTAGVLAALNKGAVDAAALWDPDLSLATKAGAHVIYSTKTASNLIFDGIVCDQRYLSNPANEQAFTAFADGWFTGVKAVKADKSLGVTAMVATGDMYKMLVQDHGAPFVQSLFTNLVLTDLSDNIRILGLGGGTNHYERVYTQFDGVYRGMGGTLTNPQAPVINASDSIDYRFVRKLMANDANAQLAAKKPEFTFTASESQAVAKTASPAITKPVVINFDTNSAILTARAEAIVNNELVPMVENFGNSYFEVSGNTDSTGGAAVNKKISLARAQAVVDYLVKEWEFPRERFTVKGNGPDAPLCNESRPEEGLTLDQCRAANRTTRVAVLGR